MCGGYNPTAIAETLIGQSIKIKENISINIVEAENGYIISGYNSGRNYQYICNTREDLESFVNILVQDLLKKD